MACLGCGNGDECSSGRKVRSVRSGVRRRVLRRSESVCGAIVDSGAVGYDCDGMMIRDRNVKLCDLAPWKAWCGLLSSVVKRSTASSALSV